MLRNHDECGVDAKLVAQLCRIGGVLHREVNEVDGLFLHGGKVVVVGHCRARFDEPKCLRAVSWEQLWKGSKASGGWLAIFLGYQQCVPKLCASLYEMDMV